MTASRHPDSLSPLFSGFCPLRSLRKSFRINTCETPCKCSFQRTYGNPNPFRINTYKKLGGGAPPAPKVQKFIPLVTLLFCILLAVAPSPAWASQSSGQATAGSAAAKSESKSSEPLPADPALAPARSLLRQDKLSEAEATTRNFLKAHADSADAHFLLGFILFREVQGKWLETGKGEGEALLYNSGDLSGAMVAYRDAKVKESLAEFTAGAKYHVPRAFYLKIVALEYPRLKYCPYS